MTKKIGDKKVGRVKSTHETDHVQGTEGVFGVGQIKATSSVRNVTRAGGVGARSPTRLMTLAEREELFKMVNEEAKKLFSNSGISSERAQAVQQAVKMAIDSGLIDDKHQPGNSATDSKTKSDEEDSEQE